MAVGKKLSRSGSTASRRRKKTGGTGAAALALGMFLAGPQAGVAAADTNPEAGDVSASTASAAPADGAAMPTRARRPVTRVAGADSGPIPAGRAAARSGSGGPLKPAAGIRPAATGTPPEGLSRPPQAWPLRATQPPVGAMRPIAQPIRPPSVVVDLGAGGQAAPPPAYSGAGGQAAPAAATATTTVPTVTAARARRLAVAGNLNQARAKLFDALANWVAVLPNQKLSDMLAGALLEARRRQADQAPTASPVQETTASTGRIIGTLGAVDPEGDPLAYAVVTNPRFGSVEVDQRGRYTYTPGDTYPGSDTLLTVAVDAVDAVIVDADGVDVARALSA